MIIMGTRGVTYTKSRGDFHCPQCATQSPYRQKRVRRFFTLYFIPILPLNMLGEYVECPQCRGTFKTDVLNWDPDAAAAEFEAEFQRGLKRVMIEMLLADGVVEDDEVEMCRQIYNNIAGRSITPQELRAEITEAQQDGTAVTQYLQQIAPMLNDRGKELIVSGAFFVSAADGEFQEQEQQFMLEIAHAMGLSPAHLHGIISSLTQSEGQPATAAG